MDMEPDQLLNPNISMNTSSVVQSDCPEVSVPISVFTTIGLISLAENFLVVVAVIRNSNLHSPMYFFICSLAAFNTIASLTKTVETQMIGFADGGPLEKKGFSEKKLDDVIDSLVCMAFVGSISSFLAIAVDRYITIFHALRYHNIMTMQRAKGVLIIIWTACGLSAVLMVRFFDSTFIMINFVIFFLLSLTMICFLYIFIFMLARMHARNIASLPSSGGRKWQWRGSSMRGAFTLTILVGVFVVCWAPFFLHLVLLMVCPFNPYCECYRSLFHLHMVLMMSHALIDPAIYAFRSAELRQTFRRMLLCSNWMPCV